MTNLYSKFIILNGNFLLFVIKKSDLNLIMQLTDFT